MKTILAVLVAVSITSCGLMNDKEKELKDTLICLDSSVVNKDTIAVQAIDTVAAMKLIDSLKTK